ncbi:hypothetical protein DRH14_01740 [Candidatus Shapirobacteria bacterium]|nr:MAG: hypothetical protein DRH14_01740 [Candidatus Shapirobacteria bacterium]
MNLVPRYFFVFTTFYFFLPFFYHLCINNLTTNQMDLSAPSHQPQTEKPNLALINKLFPIIFISLTVLFVSILVYQQQQIKLLSSKLELVSTTPHSTTPILSVTQAVLPTSTSSPVISPTVSREFTFTKPHNLPIHISAAQSFKVLDRFKADELYQNNLECGLSNGLDYFQKFVNSFSENEQGHVYEISYTEPSQEPKSWVLTIIPNQIGYTDIAEFRQNFNICAVGGTTYPFLLSKKYLMFVSACGSGADDMSGLPHGCDIISKTLSDLIKLNDF